MNLQFYILIFLFLLLPLPTVLAETLKIYPDYDVDYSQPTGILQKRIASNRPKVALAFSGGVSRGLAHIGVLRAFEENKIPATGGPKHAQKHKKCLKHVPKNAAHS